MGGPKGVEASLRQFGVERTNEVHLKPAWLISANFFLPVFEELFGQRSVSEVQC